MDAGEPFRLNEEQQARLLALRAAWDEGEDEERLERLRLREEDAETVRAFSQILADADFARGANLAWAQMAHLLSLARALAPNPNLDARLLRRHNEPESMNHDLRELLFGRGSDANRLRGFLSRRHAGGQTVLQLLCAHQPAVWPLVTRPGLRALSLSPTQERAASQMARIRFDLPAEVKGIETYSNQPVHVGIPDNDLILRLLTDVIVYEAVRETLDAPDYLAVHRLLTRGMLNKSTRGRVLSSAASYPPANAYAPDGYNAPELARSAAQYAQPTDSTLDYSIRNGAQNAAALVREPSRPDYDADHFVDTANAPAAPLPAPVDTTGYTQSDLLTTLEREIAAQGFTYPPLILRDYYLCLQSKPFALLSGLSGTGKTRLTSLFAHALTGHLDTQYRLLPARPDWTDSASIVGYVNLLAPERPQANPQNGNQPAGGRGTFVSTPFLDFLARAARPENARRAFFLCLDEMNLARVEHYFAEILSAMETPKREFLLPDGRMARLPANLFLSGTLNLDEATHSLSRKVLDRANTLTFGDVCLREDNGALQQGERDMQVTEEDGEQISYPVRQALFLEGRVGEVAQARQRLRDVSPPGADYAAHVVHVLADVNGVLEPHGLHFAYRVRDETLRYCANSFDVDGSGLLSPDAPDDRANNLRTALDFQLLQKVLPRLTGTQEQLDTPTTELLRYAEKHHLAQTTRRLARLQARLRRDGYAGFDAL